MSNTEEMESSQLMKLSEDEAIEGMIKEGNEIMDECEEETICDAEIISAGLRQFAETLGLTKAIKT